jgi:hypothetical protein
MSGPSRFVVWADRLLAALWMLMGAAFLVALGIQIAALLPVVKPQTTWESAPLQLAWQIRQGETVYTDWRSGPIHVGVYGPAYYWLVGTIGRIADLNRIEMIALGRSLSVAGFAVALALLALLATGRDGRGWAWAIPFVALGSLPVQSVEFITSARPDTMALALSFAGILLAMRRGRWSAVAAAMAIAIAVFNKPTAVAAPLAIALAAIREPSRGRLLGLLGILGVGVAGGVLALQAATGGLFWLHQQVTLAAPQKWGYAFFVLTKGRIEDQPRFLGAMVAIALLTRFVRPGFPGLPDSLRRSWRWATAYLFAATLVAVVTARRQGSNINYLIEPILVSGWVLALWARSVAATTDRMPKLVGRALAGVALLNPSLMYLDAHVISARQVAEVSQLLGPDYPGGGRWLRAQQQPLLCMDPWLAYRSDVEGYVNDPIAFGSMCVTRPEWDVLTRLVKRRFFASVVIIGPIDAEPTYIHQGIRHRWPALQNALVENYAFADRYGPWYRYVPK